ncbi:MAG: T9SS type B sorting domain-containing protein [Urechidicola sp.]|nr:T9SS type B sorting domain-containing protein [Urechidicola sp.]
MKIAKYIKGILCLLTVCVAFEATAQFSKTHYIPPITAHDTHKTSLPKEQYLYISTPSTTSFNVKITPVGGAPENFTISNGSPIEYAIREKAAGENNLSAMFSQFITPSSTTGTKFNNLGYIIEADNQVYVSVRLLAGTKYEQAGAVVSKGLAGLGNTFRVGALPSLIRASSQADFIGGTKLDFISFVSVMATEDNTQVDFSDFSSGVTILNGTPTNVILDNGESYIIALQTNVSVANFDGLVGVLVQSSKPIAVNSGSFNGTSHDSQGSRDVGIDQIVPIERIGQEFIFVRARGGDNFEKPIIVAHQDNTEIFIDGGGVAIATINAGEYHVIDGSDYGADGNMYVSTSNDVYAYQGIGGTTNASNQGMFFVPPLNCKTPKIVDNIPFVNNVGQLGVINIYNEDGSVYETKDVSAFDGGLSIVTEIGSVVTVNGTEIMTFGAVKQLVTGNSNYETYFIESLPSTISNVSITSTGELYVASFGANDKAAFGGYYSGFEFKPEIIFTDTSSSNLGTCIPNVELSLNDISYYDSYQWFLDNVPIAGANSNTYLPTQPGYYYVEGSILGCPPSLASDKIPISLCPSDYDNDGVNDNVDNDIDNDGIINCAESYNSESLNLVNPVLGAISGPNISFTGNIEPVSATTYVTGTTDGNFSSTVPPNEALTYKLDFSSNVNIAFEFASSGSVSLNNDESFRVVAPINNTITLLDPDDQLLIDTDYDGIYESGITEFSSFDIRFKIKNTSMAIGSGTFSFLSHATPNFSFIHSNETQSTNNSDARFNITITCPALDSDNDGVENAFDLDSDNDAIPDVIEAYGQIITLSNSDTNQDGLDDVFSGANPINSDSDTVVDFLDLDSDNDGIFDLEESNSTLPDNDFNGIVDNVNTIIGINGWVDSAETTPDSGIINYAVLDTDSDGVFNYIDIDSDDDGCTDVVEADFTEGSISGEIANTGFDANGVALGSDGYTIPNSDYIIAAIITIANQPEDVLVCESENASFVIGTNADTIQWEVSVSGSGVWTNVVDDAVYSGSATNTLLLSNADMSHNQLNFRAVLNSAGNGCGLISDVGIVTINQVVAPTGSVTQNFCFVDSATVSDLMATGNSIQWYADSISIIPLAVSTPLIDGASYFATQTIGGCESVNRFEVTVSLLNSPDIVNPGTQFGCDSYSLPVISGSNLTGNEAYYNNNQANSGAIITGPITTSQTVWIFDQAGTCNAEESFEVIINSAPIADAPSDIIQCDSYTLPTLTVGNYYTGSGAVGSMLNAGDVITSSQTLFVFAESGTNPNCTDENSFDITIEISPVADAPMDVTECDGYILPLLTSGNYFTGSLGTGTPLFDGDLITTTQTIYVYESTINCDDENNFIVTINTTPIVATPIDETHCDSYVLPTLTNGNYFTGASGSGTILNSGDVITSSQTIYIYAETGTVPNCTNESSFTITIEASPVADTPSDISECDNYTLPVLTNGDYYSGTGGSGIMLSVGDIVTTSQILYVYAETANCSDENSFQITITAPISIDNPGPQGACDSYGLPIITGTNLSGNEAYYSDSQANGGSLLVDPITSSQTVWIYDEVAGCSAEENFEVTIFLSPEFTLEDQQICSSDSNPSVVLEPILSNPSALYDYYWIAPSGTEFFTQSILAIEQGQYSLTVTNTDGSGCVETKDVVVNASETATITLEDITVVEFSSNNSFTIDDFNYNLGQGDYEYSISGIDGPYQDSNYFDNLGGGIYTLYVRDKNGCGVSDPLDISVGAFPKFFTPNNDFHNDTWNVVGASSDFMPNTPILIFDRFGKIIKEILPNGQGWDGYYNGKKMPSSDYWFQITLQDGRIYKGHFSLVSR